MSDEAELRVASFGDPQHTETIELAECIRAAVAEYLGHSSDPNRISVAMTAACMFAGSLLGTLIVSGIARDQDKRRVTESMMRNFRSGIDVGKHKALRIATEQFEGNA
jgi:hypothetical protein